MDAQQSRPLRPANRSWLGPSLRRVQTALAPFFWIFMFLVVWELLARQSGISKLILPVPSAIAVDMYAQAGYLLDHGLITVAEAVGGFLLAIVLGIPLAYVITQSSSVKNTVYVFMLASNSLPKVAIAPLFVIWLGYGLPSKVVIAFLIAFFPVVINAVAGLNSVPRELIDLGMTSGANKVRLFFMVNFPSALPQIFSGLKVAISLAVTGALVSEFVAADAGLGWLILVAQGTFNTVRVFSGIMALAILGTLLFFMVEIVETLVIPWHVAKRRRDTGRGAGDIAA